MNLKSTFLISVVLVLGCYASAFAEVKEIIAEGSYNMGDGETPLVAEKRALREAKKIAVEEAGIYIESYLLLKNTELVEHESRQLASGIMEVEILAKKRDIVGDGIRFWVKIRTRVSTDNIEKMARRVKEKGVAESYQKLQEAYDKSQQEVGKLKKQLIDSKNEKEKKQIYVQITDEEKLFQANEWYEKGVNLALRADYKEARDALITAIEFNPNHAFALALLGIIYSSENADNKEGHEKAVNYMEKAITIWPNTESFLMLGRSYRLLGQYNKSLESLHKALSIEAVNKDKGNRTKIYVYMGNTHMNMKQYEKAKKSYENALYIDKNSPDALAGIGVVLVNSDNKFSAVHADYFFRAGLLYLEQDNRSGALTSYEALKIMNSETLGEYKSLEKILFKKLYPKGLE